MPEDYKDSKFYTTVKSPEEVKDENAAIAALFLCESKFFNKFYLMSINLKNEIIRKENLATDEKTFLDNFRIFLHDIYPEPHFDKLVWCAIFRLSEKIRTLNAWKGDFRDYVQSIHNEGIIFPNICYANLKKLGIELSYTREGWAYNFYADWVKRKPLWTLQEAAKLYMGSDPYNGREFEGMGEPQERVSGYKFFDIESILFVNSNEETEISNVPLSDFQNSLKKFIDDNIAAGELSTKNGKFEPLEIISFFKKKIPNTHQPLALFEVLGIADKPNEKIIEKYQIQTMTKSDRETVLWAIALEIYKGNKTLKVIELHKKIKEHPSVNNNDIPERKWNTFLHPITKKELDSKIAKNR